ncbi:hypothetical protein V8G54_021807 [Vigna mungo]|uniref:Uncharacterized protein n=1 Tax=Vigna mungo TaxID=3915 RepID=A0AAQ3RXZ9_VIGMU
MWFLGQGESVVNTKEFQHQSHGLKQFHPPFAPPVRDSSPYSFVAFNHYRPLQLVMAPLQASSLLDDNLVPIVFYCPPLSKSSYLKFHGVANIQAEPASRGNIVLDQREIKESNLRRCSVSIFTNPTLAKSQTNQVFINVPTKTTARRVGALWWWDNSVASLGWAMMAKRWPAHFKLRAWVSRLLKWRTQREAGFTEQRKPPSPNSGGITGCCYYGPTKVSGLFYIYHGNQRSNWRQVVHDILWASAIEKSAVSKYFGPLGLKESKEQRMLAEELRATESVGTMSTPYSNFKPSKSQRESKSSTSPQTKSWPPPKRLFPGQFSVASDEISIVGANTLLPFEANSLSLSVPANTFLPIQPLDQGPRILEIKLRITIPQRYWRPTVEVKMGCQTGSEEKDDEDAIKDDKEDDADDLY